MSATIKASRKTKDYGIWFGPPRYCMWRAGTRSNPLTPEERQFRHDRHRSIDLSGDFFRYFDEMEELESRIKNGVATNYSDYDWCLRNLWVRQ